jgi:hypothetical protein
MRSAQQFSPNLNTSGPVKQNSIWGKHKATSKTFSFVIYFLVRVILCIKGMERAYWCFLLDFF